MCVLPLAALVAWLALPSLPITVALLAISLLVAVFIGIGMVLRSRELDEKPDREPVTPPSAEQG